MEYDSKNLRDLPETEQGLSPELRELLQDSHPAPEILSWDRVAALVESAPPVRVPWYMAFLESYQRQLRYAAVPLLVMLMLGGMWVMPAQSLNVGTTVVAELPQDWSPDSPQFAELQQASMAEFKALGLPQSDIRMMVMPQSSSHRLVMVLSGADELQADGFYNSLAERFPVLAAVDHEMLPIEARKHDNLFREISSRIGGSQEIEGLSDNQLTLLVFNVLSEAGFSNIRLDIHRTVNGKVLIDVQADPDGTGSTSELSLDELRNAGLNSGNLGPDADDTLSKEFGVD